MTGRIIPYMKRRTADEWRRRRAELIARWWETMLTPARIFAGLWR